MFLGKSQLTVFPLSILLSRRIEQLSPYSMSQVGISPGAIITERSFETAQENFFLNRLRNN